MKAKTDSRFPIPDSRLITLQPGAWFIADAHYARYRPALYDFLNGLPSEALPPQIVLMGDIFDLLFGYAPNSVAPNRSMVDLLLRIAESREVIYLEGNHDFGLAPIFSGKIAAFSRKEQPVIGEVAGRRFALHHACPGPRRPTCLSPVRRTLC
jgi:UDP-2,3-diacylglucosamine hydrolase